MKKIIVSACLMGAMIGFLCFNLHPAKIFMGDTGSMALGGVLSAMAIVGHMEWLLPIAGLIYVIEALSVIIQVTYFKITHGKRLFKMTPIHHSFELSGYSEKQICYLFGGCSLLACALVLIWVFAYFL